MNTYFTAQEMCSTHQSNWKFVMPILKLKSNISDVFMTSMCLKKKQLLHFQCALHCEKNNVRHIFRILLASVVTESDLSKDMMTLWPSTNM